MNIFPAFAVPMCALALPNSTELNSELRRLLLERETPSFANPKASMELHTALFESDFDLFSWQDEPIVNLRRQLWQAVGAFVASINNYDQAALNRIQIKSHTWFHVTRRGGYFGLHNHPMASISGVYCVAPGMHDSQQTNSGVLRFHSPNNTSNMYMDAGNANLQGEFVSGNRSFSLRAGELVLFPSWLMHEVLPYQGDGERITIAFNCWFTRG